MLRAMIPMVLVLILNLIDGGRHHAMAFTVRFGSVPVTESAASIHDTADADLPTPRMLNLAVDARGVTFGPMSTAPEVIRAAPPVRIRRKTQPPIASEPRMAHARSRTIPRQLSGVEIMLLRHAEQVAER